MNDKLFKLTRYFYKKIDSDRSHFYRFHHWLDRKCSEITSLSHLQTKEEIELCKRLCLFAPIAESDLENKTHKNIYQIWKRKFPQDKKFFQMMLGQKNIWNKFSNQSLKTFLESEECKKWFKNRSQLKRKSTFELDTCFKKSKEKAKNYEQSLQKIMRDNPLLRWEDLRSMGVKNAQSIYQNFHAKKHYQNVFLLKLKSQIAAEANGRKKR
ncbi:MAG: hypothetical protein J0M01_02550 [Dechloromonas sp.]|nr:hypothetical protein [Dechloromonas sp.]MBN8555357.1 hypothetical protein [Deltaproteobacteria bacterium]